MILYLLGKNKIEIQDIPIALILEQYLAYLERRQQMDLEVASEFLEMASRLVYIKTVSLLPPPRGGAGEGQGGAGGPAAGIPGLQSRRRPAG